LAYFKAAGLRQVAVISAAAMASAFSFSTPALAASRHLGQRTLREGMNGHDVRVLQQYLTLAGFPTPVDGSFGPTTKNHVVGFEHRYRLAPAVGVVGIHFVSMIRSVVANRQGTQAVSDSSGGVSFTIPVKATPPTPSAPTTTPGAKATIVNGLAVAPASAPTAIKNVIAAANKIAFKPYVYGGGHGSWISSGYDCSGSVSFALHGGGLLSQTEDSSELESYGGAGPGQWITIWANAGHVYMYVAGLRFDTAAQGSTGGSRWTSASTDNSGYVERHPTGY
jgi:peptidoglycan hydrolase-like protein with peptidoglycan-binding domain